jgi:hypothetical protein
VGTLVLTPQIDDLPFWRVEIGFFRGDDFGASAVQWTVQIEDAAAIVVGTAPPDVLLAVNLS